MNAFSKNKKLAIIVVLSLLVVTPTAFAASSTFLLKATQWYQGNCKNGNVPRGTAIDCYLFDKVGELDVNLGSLTNRMSSVEGRLTTLENATPAPSSSPTPAPSPTPTPSPNSQAVKVFDANGVELGIYLHDYTFFYPPVNRLIDVQSTKLGYFGGNLYFSDSYCNGDAYISIGNNDLSLRGNQVFSIEAGKYYILEPGTPASTVSYATYGDSTGCLTSNSSGTSSNLRLLKKVEINLPDPVPFPLQFKFQ